MLSCCLWIYLKDFHLHQKESLSDLKLNSNTYSAKTKPSKIFKVPKIIDWWRKATEMNFGDKNLPNLWTDILIPS